jgi:hypothetical protein
MVIFHSYVKLPEGILVGRKSWEHLGTFDYFEWLHPPTFPLVSHICWDFGWHVFTEMIIHDRHDSIWQSTKTWFNNMIINIGFDCLWKHVLLTWQFTTFLRFDLANLPNISKPHFHVSISVLPLRSLPKRTKRNFGVPQRLGADTKPQLPSFHITTVKDVWFKPVANPS